MSVRGMLWLGGACMGVGWLLILLATIRVLPQSFPLAFVATALLIAGAATGFYGVFIAFGANRRD